MSRHDERGAAVVDFVLVMLVLVPLVLGVLQVGLVLHVRNTLTAAASDGARSAAALGATPDDGVRRTRSMIVASLDDRYARDVSSGYADVAGVPGTVVRVRASVPALGLFGPGVDLDVTGHAVREEAP